VLRRRPSGICLSPRGDERECSDEWIARSTVPAFHPKPCRMTTVVYAPEEVGGGGPLSRQAKWMSSPTTIERTFAADMGGSSRNDCVWRTRSGLGRVSARLIEAKHGLDCWDSAECRLDYRSDFLMLWWVATAEPCTQRANFGTLWLRLIARGKRGSR
jgi:hypothetical protein